MSISQAPEGALAGVEAPATVPVANQGDRVWMPERRQWGWGDLLALTVWALDKRPAWGFLGACFFLVLAPTSSFLPLQGSAACEHRMYLPLAAVLGSVVTGVCLAGQWLAHRGTISLTILRASGCCLAVCTGIALGTVTFQRNRSYQSTLSIWQDTVAKAPGNYRAHTNLGLVLAGRGQSAEAIAQYQAALEI